MAMFQRAPPGFQGDGVGSVNRRRPLETPWAMPSAPLKQLRFFGTLKTGVI